MANELITICVCVGSPRAAMLVHRSGGRVAFAGIDARLAQAACLARDFQSDAELAEQEGIFGGYFTIALKPT
jgi:hypothetical protein